MKILKDKGYKIIAHLYGGVPGAGTNFENTIILDKIKKNIVEYDLCNEVIIEGFSEDIKTSLNNVGIVVLPSYAEGTPNVLLEGMLLKKIVIASDVGGIPEFITDNKTGFLHRSGAAEELASIIIKVHNAPQILLEKMALEAENLVKLEYNSNQLIEGLISIYKKHEERQ